MTSLSNQKVSIGFPLHPMQAYVTSKMKRFTVLVCHRRFGKTVLAVSRLLASAINAKRRGLINARFGYIAPFRKQAKRNAWVYFKLFAKYIPGVEFNDTELTISFPWGAVIELFGANDPGSIRGTYFDGVVLDEVAIMRPQTWDAVVQPMLADRQGWALFIGTPQGVNRFYQLYDYAVTSKDPLWTGILIDIYAAIEYLPQLNMEEVEISRTTMSDSMFRQEWLCDFNAENDDVLIPIDLVNTAMRRTADQQIANGAAKVIGVDVARFGSDRTCFFCRQGLRALEPEIYRDLDNMQVVGKLMHLVAKWQPDAVFIDASPISAGVIDRMRELWDRKKVIEVQFGGSPLDKNVYLNKRAEMWDSIKEWLEQGGCLPFNTELRHDLVAPTYEFSPTGLMKLESKEHMKEQRGLASPDLADALALTFAYPVTSKRNVVVPDTKYNPLNYRVGQR